MSAVGRSMAALGQPQAEGHGDEGDRQGGQQLEDEGGQEGDPQGAHGRLAVAVGDQAYPLHLGVGPPEQAEGGQALEEVEEPVGQPLQRRPTGGPSGPRSGRPIRTMKSGTRGITTRMTAAERRSAARIRRPAARGTTAATVRAGR